VVATPQCSNCFFSFVAPASANTVANNRGAALATLRFCNRQAPSADAANPNGWLWPQVADDWWCGEGADDSTGQAYANSINGVPGTGGAGPGYLATSVTSLTVAASGSFAPVTQLNLAYTAGARCRITSRGSGAWVEGVVTNYAADGTLTFTADASSGSGAHTDWDINIAGQPGTNGTNGLGIASWGQFTLGAAMSTTTVTDSNIQTNSRIVFTPANSFASALVRSQGSGGTAAGIYVSAVTAGVSFAVTLEAGSAVGNETFNYIASTT